MIASGFLIKGYNVIQENATNKIVIESLKQVNAQNLKTITNLEMDARLKNVIIEERDAQIDQLQAVTDGFVANLGEGQNDLAPAPIRKYLENLKNGIK